PLTGDDANQQITLPFAVTYYGMQYQKLWVSTNGYAAFTQPAALGAPTAAPPQPDPYTNALFPFADDLVVDASSSVRTATTAAAPALVHPRRGHPARGQRGRVGRPVRPAHARRVLRPDVLAHLGLQQRVRLVHRPRRRTRHRPHRAARRGRARLLGVPILGRP